MSLPFYPHDIHWNDELAFQKEFVDKMKKEIKEQPKCKECNNRLTQISLKPKKFICTDSHCKRYKEPQ